MLSSMGYGDKDINGYKMTTTYQIPNLLWLSNPIIWIKNKLSKSKQEYHKPISTYEKIIYVPGMSAVKVERLLNLHNVIKQHEEKEMKKASKRR